MKRLPIIQLPDNLEPLQQGELDKLCGVYAAINAIKVADDRTGKRVGSLLFTCAISYLVEKGQLEEAVTSGMGHKRQRLITEYLLKTYNQRHNAELGLTYFSDSLLDLEDFIEGQLEQGFPVCVCLNGAVDHFTVLTGMNRTRVLLFDSNGMSFVQRSSVSFEGKRQNMRYWIKPVSVFSFEMHDPWE